MAYTPGNNTDFNNALAYYFDTTATVPLPGGTNVTSASVGQFNNPATKAAIGTWITTAVTNMSDAFNSKTTFNEDISSWDTTNVTLMTSMFQDAHAFNQPIGNWNTSNVTSMSYMFYKAAVFNQPIGNWNTSNVITFQQMFQEAVAFNQDIGNWDTSKVTNFLQMFYGAVTFNQDISRWNTTSATTMERMFAVSTSFNQNIRYWKVSPSVNLNLMFNLAFAMIANYSSVAGFGVTPQYIFFNFVDRVQYGFGMPFKTTYMSQSPFAISRSMFRRTTTSQAESKNFKTQNKSRDSFGRLNRLTTKAARSSTTIDGVVPNFKNVDQNYVNSQLTFVRNLGSSAPAKKGAY